MSYYSATGTVRVPLPLEHSKFKTDIELRRFYHKHQEQIAEPFKEFKHMYGVRLSLPCFRAVHAILAIAQNQYPYDGQKEDLSLLPSDNKDMENSCVIIEFPMTEYLAAYGLENTGGKAAEEARNAFLELTKDRYLLVKTYSKDKQNKLRTELIKEPFLEIIETSAKKRNRRFTAKLGTALTRGSYRFYSAKPSNWYNSLKTIQKSLETRGLHIVLFMDYLMTLDSEMPTGYGNLVNKMHLGAETPSRQFKKVNEALKAAYEHGYLSSFACFDNKEDKVTLNPNPDVCSRRRREKQRGKNTLDLVEDSFLESDDSITHIEGEERDDIDTCLLEDTVICCDPCDDIDADLEDAPLMEVEL